jgi:hypothetical protein
MNIVANGQGMQRLCPGNFRDLCHFRTLLCSEDRITRNAYSHVLTQETTVCL